MVSVERLKYWPASLAVINLRSSGIFFILSSMRSKYFSAKRSASIFKNSLRGGRDSSGAIRALNLLPCYFLNLFQRGDVFGVACQARGHFPSNGTVEEVHIADEIKYLMTGKFFCKAKLRIHDLFIIDQDEIMEPPSSSHSHPLQHLNIF